MLKVAADLHTHTAFSDGTLTPIDLVERVQNAGLSAFAITDHDTIAGLGEAREAAAKTGLTFIPGIEISARLDGEEVHMLGYHFDPDHASMVEYTENMPKYRVVRAGAMVDKLSDLGVHLQIERVLEIAGPGSVGRPHVAEAIVEAGYANDVVAAFRQYIGNRAPAFVATDKMDAIEVIRMLQDAGGIAVVAHPGHWTSDRLLMTLIREGLDGVEVSHPSHDESLMRYYRNLARDFALITTGGSDYHGRRPDDDSLLGRFGVSTEQLERIESRSLGAQRRGES